MCLTGPVKAARKYNYFPAAFNAIFTGHFFISQAAYVKNVKYLILINRFIIRKLLKVTKYRFMEKLGGKYSIPSVKVTKQF